MTFTDEVPLDPTLVGLAAEISGRMIWGHLINRPTDVLEPTSPDFPLVVDHIRDIAAEVTAIVGTDPTQPRRDLALGGIAMGVARNLEETLFPEQQLGDSTRAEQLDRRYQARLKLLRDSDGSLPDTGSAPEPLGNFPDPPTYPDPVEPTPGFIYAPGYYW